MKFIKLVLRMVDKTNNNNQRKERFVAFYLQMDWLSCLPSLSIQRHSRTYFSNSLGAPFCFSLIRFSSVSILVFRFFEQSCATKAWHAVRNVFQFKWILMINLQDNWCDLPKTRKESTSSNDEINCIKFSNVKLGNSSLYEHQICDMKMPC